ncbi:MAG: THUMP-like domain-containing protein [Thermaurantimonas sp.]|uniref:THUMP-like domain-containing protein n=1 Tax=Thermaurantimonas sp. TaxID=2681568 RepID=UPI003918AE6B
MSSKELFEQVSLKLERGEYTNLCNEVQHLGIEKAVLKYNSNPLLKEASQQCHARHKYKKKFEVLIRSYPGWLFPPGLPLQQASHHLTSTFKSRILSSYNTVIDLTGGLGMDTVAFACAVSKTIYLERNKKIFDYNDFNFSKYLPHIERYNLDAFEWLRKFRPSNEKTLIYADPARRTTTGKKTFHPADYDPNPSELYKSINGLEVDLLLKVSPVADLEFLSRYIGPPAKVYLLAVEDELKEVLLLYASDTLPPLLEIWLCGEPPHLLFSSDRLTHQNKVPVTAKPENFIYIPHAALVKNGADKALAENLGLTTFHQNARIYTSSQLMNMPGWRVYRTLRFSMALPELQVTEAMVITGKFPDSAENIRKKHKIAESDTRALIATKTEKNKNLWILAEKL